ncbi:MAG TPA: hypothetical protein VKL19_15840 [Thermoanaerobaculia bacterium]|nr:hypothetical protein [Thermoanaerobaculia bacterium]
MPDWPHSPLHRIRERGIYFITAGTYLKQHFYRTHNALDQLQQLLFVLSEKHGLLLHAWALLSNHYHLVIEGSLQPFFRQLHSIASHDRNHADGVEGRRVWFQYRDTQLTYERSYLARLKYVHENAVHHGIVLRATNYRWCSAQWFEDNAERPFVQTVQRLKIDRLKVLDDFQPEVPQG